MNYTQYAWDHIVYIFPDQIQREIAGCCADGYRRIVTQGWYFGVFSINYLALAEYAWNATSCPINEFWNMVLEKEFGRDARDLMRIALEHTRFDLRFDIIARAIFDDKLEKEFTFWDMYVLSRIKVNDQMLEELENDARQSLMAAQTALTLTSLAPYSREMVKMTVISAERRLYLATSTRHLLKALQMEKSGDLPAARDAMDRCLEEGGKLYQAATQLGMEFPMAVHDDKIVSKFRQIELDMH